jgi:hypothetical protein
MSNQSQKSPLPENSAEEEKEEGQQEEEEDKKLQEPSQEATGGGGDERKVATLPPSAQKTSVARKGPVLKRCAANATNSCPLKKVTRAVTSPEVEEEIRQQHIRSLSILLQTLQKPPGGGGGDKRKVTALPPSAKKTSTARNGPARKPYVANLIRAKPCKQVRTRAISSRRVFNLNAKSLQASKKFVSPRQPLGTPAERPLENSAKDGVSQGKEKKIKDKVHGEDDEESEGGGEENPSDDSDSI